MSVVIKWTQQICSYLNWCVDHAVLNWWPKHKRFSNLERGVGGWGGFESLLFLKKNFNIESSSLTMNIHSFILITWTVFRNNYKSILL